MHRRRLPSPLSSFVGRRKELAELTKLVAGHRLVTIVGPGGAGKTRLVTELGRLVARQMVFADLSPVRMAGMVPAHIASAAGIAERGDRPPMTAITEELRGGARLLIVDNCEHLLEESAEVIHELLQRCPDLVVLATSRQPLEVPGELVWRIPPLSLPDPETPQPLESFDAIKLFAERASARTPGYQVASVESVAEICRRLDGMPLAIELASAWVAVLSESEILDRVTNDLSLLEVRGTGMPERHRTMTAAIDWSYHLLDEGVRRVFCRLGVFAGSFDLHAAEDVTGEHDALRALSTLVDSSLVVVETRWDPTRYRLLETVRQFAVQRLERLPESADVHRRHATHYLSLAEEAESVRHTPAAVEWMKRLSAEVDNLRTALEWLLRWDPEGAVQMAGALAWFWQSKSSIEGRAWLDRALASKTTLNRFRSRAADWAGWLELRRMNPERATSRIREGLEVSEKIGDKAGVARALTGLGPMAMFDGKPEESRRMLEQALVLAREAGDTRIEGGALTSLGALWINRGDLDRAASYLQDAIAVYRSSGNLPAKGMALIFSGVTATRAGDRQAALGALSEALDTFESLADVGGVAMVLEIIAMAAEHLDLAQRVRLSAAGQATLDENVIARPPFWEAYLASWRESQRRKLGARWDQAWAQGRSMSLEHAVQIARGGAEAPFHPEGWDRLSRREREVAQLLAEGLSNAEIAQRLFISERTVESHVGSILVRLGFRSRSQVAAWIGRVE